MQHEKIPAVLTKTHVWTAVLMNIIAIFGTIIGTANYLIPRMIAYHVDTLIEQKYQPRWEREFSDIRTEVERNRTDRLKQIDDVAVLVRDMTLANEEAHKDLRAELRQVYVMLLDIKGHK